MCLTFSSIFQWIVNMEKYHLSLSPFCHYQELCTFAVYWNTVTRKQKMWDFQWNVLLNDGLSLMNQPKTISSDSVEQKRKEKYFRFQKNDDPFICCQVLYFVALMILSHHTENSDIFWIAHDMCLFRIVFPKKIKTKSSKIF